MTDKINFTEFWHAIHELPEERHDYYQQSEKYEEPALMAIIEQDEAKKRRAQAKADGILKKEMEILLDMNRKIPFLKGDLNMEDSRELLLIHTELRHAVIERMKALNT